MENIHLLPIGLERDIKSPIIWEYPNTNEYRYSLHKEMNKEVGYNMYITSSEEIKEGDWGLSKLNEVILFGRSYNEKFYKKIILTTDATLIEDGVQAIDDTFLEWFVENPTCEFVKTELLNVSEVLWEEYFKKHGVYPKYPYYEKIIIPQEESKQKFSRKWKELKDAKPSEPLKSWDDESEEEALEKAATNYSHDWENITGLDPDDVSPFGASIVDFKSGAKWQAERMYSEEEVLKIINKFNEIHYHPSEEWEITEWFEQHKKK